MAFDYDSGAGFFDKCGALIKAINIFETFETGNLATEMEDILDKIESSNDYDDQCKQLYFTIKNEFEVKLRQTRESLLPIFDNLLLQELDEEEDFHSSDRTAMLDFLDFLMRERDTETVLQNTVTLTGPTDGSPAATGDFEVVASKYASTAEGADSSSQENGIAKSNYFRIWCINNDSSGAELFNVQGNLPRSTSRFHPNWENLGLAGQLTTISSVTSMLPNGGFEVSNAAGDGANGWEDSPGSWGTHIEWVTGAGNFYRGDYGTEFNFSATNPAITYTFPTKSLEPWTKYLISFKVKRVGAVTGNGTLKVGFTGTSGLYFEETNVNTNIGTSWEIQSHIFNTGEDPSAIVDFIIEVTVGTTGSVIIDEVCLTKMDIFGGIGIAVIGGATDPAIDDYWTLNVANNKTSDFQTFFGRFFDVLLPGSGTPSILDSLAE